jgi:integrase
VLVKWWRYENVFISQHLKNRILKFEQELKNKYPYTIWTYVISHIKIRDRGRVFTPERASSTIHKYVSILQEKWELDKNITLHQARHSFAMRCVYSGISHQATMQLMRHKDPKSTLHYYHLNDTWLQEQFDKVQ